MKKQALLTANPVKRIHDNVLMHAQRRFCE